MADGFKGTEIGIAKLMIADSNVGSAITVDVQFCDKEGVVHAITKHSISVNVSPGMRDAVSALLEEVTNHIESLHFTSGQQVQAGKKVTFDGIAESISSGQSSPYSDRDIGEQG